MRNNQSISASTSVSVVSPVCRSKFVLWLSILCIVCFYPSYSFSISIPVEKYVSELYYTHSLFGAKFYDFEKFKKKKKEAPLHGCFIHKLLLHSVVGSQHIKLMLFF